MWSQTKKALMERMADNLKSRVRYNFQVFTTKNYHSKMSIFCIYVDDDLCFATNPMYYSKCEEFLDENANENLSPHEYWKVRDNAWHDALEYASKCGLMDVDHMMRHIHEYLNEYSVKECLDSENYALRMLAVLDRRIGKRTIEKLLNNISNEPEWFQKFIVLRAESEGIQTVIKN